MATRVIHPEKPRPYALVDRCSPVEQRAPIRLQQRAMGHVALHDSDSSDDDSLVGVFRLADLREALDGLREAT